MGFTKQPINTGNRAVDVALNMIQDALSLAIRGVETAVRSLTEPEVKVINDAFTITAENVVEYVGSGGHTITLPPANSIPGRRSRVRWIINNGTAAITLAAQGGDTANGAVSQTLVGADVITSKAMVGVVSNGKDSWSVFGSTQSSLWIAATSRPSGFTSPFKVTVDGTQVAKIDFKPPVIPGDPPQYSYLVIRDLVLQQTLTLGVDLAVVSGGLQIGTTTGAKVGFHGAAPVAQAAHPTTLADVITILTNKGFCA